MLDSTGEATDQDMLAPDCSPIHPRLLGQSRFKTCLRPGYFTVMVVKLYDGYMKAVALGKVP